MRKYLNNNKGGALAGTIFIFLIVMVLVGSLFTLSAAETTHSIRSENRTQAHYVGRSGVEVGLQKIQDLLPFDGRIDELVTELNDWATGLGSHTIQDAGTFTVSYEQIGARELKIMSEGNSSGNEDLNQMVTLLVKLDTSLLVGGEKAEAWYVSSNSHNLQHSNNPESGGHSYLGEYVVLEGKDNSSTQFPSNAGGGSGFSIYRASIMQLLANTNGVSLGYSGQTQMTTFDAEVIIFDGAVRMRTDQDLRLRISEAVAKDKIDNPSSVLYVSSSIVRDEILDVDGYNGVGFENQTYYEYFTGSVFAGYSTYEFEEGIRYGVVKFGGKLVHANNDNGIEGASNLLNSQDPSTYELGLYYYPDNVNINTPEGRAQLIPMLKGDPLAELLIGDGITMSDDPFLWNRR